MIFVFKTQFSEIGVQFFPKLARDQKSRSVARNNGILSLLPWCVTSNEGLISIIRFKIRQDTSSDVVIPSMKLLSFVMLFFCDVFSDMLTLLFSILIVLFQMIKFKNNMKDYNSIDTVIANKQQYQLSLNPPRSFRFIHSFPLFLLSLPFFHSFSPVPPFIGSNDARSYGHQLVSR